MHGPDNPRMHRMVLSEFYVPFCFNSVAQALGSVNNRTSDNRRFPSYGRYVYSSFSSDTERRMATSIHRFSSGLDHKS